MPTSVSKKEQAKLERDSEFREAFYDLQGCIMVSLAQEDEFLINKTAFQIGFMLGKMRRLFRREQFSKALIITVRLRHDLVKIRGDRWPSLLATSMDRIEQCLLDVVGDPSRSSTRARDLYEAMSDQVEATAYDRDGNSLDRAVLDVDTAIQAGRKLGHVDGMLATKDVSGAFAYLEEPFREWLDGECPEFLKLVDEHIRWTLEDIGKRISDEAP